MFEQDPSQGQNPDEQQALPLIAQLLSQLGSQGQGGGQGAPSPLAPQQPQVASPGMPPGQPIGTSDGSAAQQAVTSQAQNIVGGIQQQQGTGMDRIAEMLRMAGIDGSQGKPPQVSPRESRMQFLRDFMSGTLFNIGQGLSAYSKAPVGARNQAGIGGALMGGEVRNTQREETQLKRDQLASQEKLRVSQSMSDLLKAQNQSDMNPYSMGKDIGAISERLGTTQLNLGPRAGQLNAQANEANATAANQTSQANRNRYIETPKGLIDLSNPNAGVVPGTGNETLVDISEELANTLGLPKGLIGKQLTALDINRLTTAIASPYKIVSDEKNVRLINPASGQEYVFGPPAKTGSGAGAVSRQMFQMYEMNPDTGKNELIFVQPGTGQVIRAPQLGIDPNALTTTAVANPALIAASKEVNQGAKAVRLLGIIDDLSGKLITSEGTEQIVKGNMERAQALFNQNSDFVSYDSAINAFTPMWARNLGHTGVLTQQDVDSAKSIFPVVTDSRTVRNQKMDIIKSIMGGNIQAAQQLLTQYGGSATGRVLEHIFYDKDLPGDGLGILGQFEKGRLLTPNGGGTTNQGQSQGPQQSPGPQAQPQYRGGQNAPPVQQAVPQSRTAQPAPQIQPPAEARPGTTAAPKTAPKSGPPVYTRGADGIIRRK